jgi:hypothetical protein
MRQKISLLLSTLCLSSIAMSFSIFTMDSGIYRCDNGLLDKCHNSDSLSTSSETDKCDWQPATLSEINTFKHQVSKSSKKMLKAANRYRLQLSGIDGEVRKLKETARNCVDFSIEKIKAEKQDRDNDCKLFALFVLILRCCFMNRPFVSYSYLLITFLPYVF